MCSGDRLLKKRDLNKVVCLQLYFAFLSYEDCLPVNPFCSLYVIGVRVGLFPFCFLELRFLGSVLFFQVLFFVLVRSVSLSSCVKYVNSTHTSLIFLFYMQNTLNLLAF